MSVLELLQPKMPPAPPKIDGSESEVRPSVTEVSRAAFSPFGCRQRAASRGSSLEEQG